MKTLIILLLLVPLSASAGIIASGGVSSVEGYGSEAKTPGDVSILKADPGFGATFNLELPFLYFFSLDMGVNVNQASAVSEYNHIGNNILNKTDLKTRADTVELLLGGKVRVINFKRFKVFGGAGFMVGNLKLRYDKSDYESKYGAVPSNFVDKEDQGKSGRYIEAGMDLVFSQRSAVRLAVRKIHSASSAFETLGDKKVVANYTNIGIFYMHYFDVKFLGKKK